MTGPGEVYVPGKTLVKPLPVDDLDVHQVEVHRVHVAGRVVDLPHFRVAGSTLLLGAPLPRSESQAGDPV